MLIPLRLFLLPILVVISLVFSLSCAQAQNSSDVFKPDWLSKNDAKFLQTGLTLEGLYVGLIDGDFGKGSLRALDRFMAGRYGGGQLKYRDLKPLVQRTMTAIQVDFWQGVNDFPRKATFLAPMAIMEQDHGSDLFTLQTADGSLKIRMIENDKDKTIEMHEWLLDNHKGTKQELYQSYNEKHLITSGKLKSGKTVYLRSQYARVGTIITVLVQYEPWQKARGALISASISFDGPTSLSLDRASPLGALLHQESRPAKPSQPVSGGISRPAPGAGFQPSQPGNGGGSVIARPSVPVASNSFVLPDLPPAQ